MRSLETYKFLRQIWSYVDTVWKWQLRWTSDVFKSKSVRHVKWNSHSKAHPLISKFCAHSYICSPSHNTKSLISCDTEKRVGKERKQNENFSMCSSIFSLINQSRNRREIHKKSRVTHLKNNNKERVLNH